MSKQIALDGGRYAIVDDEDYGYLSQWSWYVRRQRYVYREWYRPGQTNGRIYMHRQLLNPLPGFEVDHINGDRLDNRRANLRIVTHAWNAQNRAKRKVVTSSRYKGVYYFKSSKKWRASITVDGRKISLGLYAAEEDAAAAYNAASEKYHGTLGRKNEEAA